MSSFLDFEGEAVALQTLPEGLRVAGGPDQDVRPAVLRGHVDLCGEAGSVEFGAHVVLEAFKHGKDVILLNAEIDATIGPIPTRWLFTFNLSIDY